MLGNVWHEFWELTNDPLVGWPLKILLGIMASSLVLIFASARAKNRSSRSSSQSDQDIKRPTNTSVFRRLWWRIRPPVDLMTIDGLQIDRTRKPHMGWFGPTGAGKSSAVAAIRVDGKRPTLIATPDISDPLREATLRLGGFIWTACDSTQPVDFLIGTPTEVAERLTKVFRSGGQGVWLRAARRATAEVIRTIDDDHEPRTLQLVGQRLAFAIKSDRELKTACSMWVERFLDIADQLGDSVGPGGVDIADLLRQGKTIVLDNDAFDHLALGGDVVAFALAEGQRCASLVPGGYRLIFEEAGQLGERIDLAEPFHRAGRRRKIAVDDLTQSEDDLNEGINSNIATRAYFAQELKSLQKKAADRLGILYSKLDPANLPDFHAYIAHGRIRRLVHFPKPPKSRSYPEPHVFDPIPSQSHTPRPNRIIIEEVGSGEPPPHAALPMPSIVVQEILAQIKRTPTCWLWTGGTDKDGYGIHRWNGNNRGVHRIVWELTRGYPPPRRNAEGKLMEIDHTCRVRLCMRPDHLELTTKVENIRRMHRVRGHATAAD